MKEKRFHTPLLMAVPQTCLRYAMGASVKEKRFHTAVCNGSKYEQKKTVKNEKSRRGASGTV